MFGGAKSYLDTSGSFLANIISKNGRNEVQILPLTKKQDSVVISSSGVKIELESDESVLDAFWTERTEQPAKKRAGRKRNQDSEEKEDSPSTAKLIVLLANGDIAVFAPGVDSLLSRISSDVKSSGIAYTENGSVWTYSREESKIYEFSLADSKLVKTTSNHQNISIARGIKYKGAKTTAKSVPIVIGHLSSLQLVDISKAKNNQILIDFKQPETNNKNSFSIIRQSDLNPENIFASKKNDNIIYVFNTAEPDSFTSLVASSEIQDIVIVSDETSKTEHVMAITADGVQVFNKTEDDEASPSALIKTSHQKSEILFSNIFRSEGFYGIWYDMNEPKISKISSEIGSGELVVRIDYVDKAENRSNNVFASKDSIQVPKEESINNLPAKTLFQQLSALLSSKPLNSTKIVSLCSSNDNSDNIKEVIKNFATSSSESSELILHLFEIVSNEVAKDPAKNTSLSVWLKWILLAHGGAIAKEPQQFENLKTLQSGLNNGIKLLPHLLALQGRLQLLKSQAQLRNSIASLDINSVQNEITEDNEEDEEEDIVYANGENDEDESEALSAEDHTQQEDEVEEDEEEEDGDDN
ncbi:component of small subunit processosome [Scheffersomyces xylosifermentans]|uniref:component of small subunit processosome n=1 Tax=Scheffersomyces xylosifermentans TaxID=1304137 RepID=UPI00315D924B